MVDDDEASRSTCTLFDGARERLVSCVWMCTPCESAVRL